jgi:hypothetical protein
MIKSFIFIHHSLVIFVAIRANTLHHETDYLFRDKHRVCVCAAKQVTITTTDTSERLYVCVCRC